MNAFGSHGCGGILILYYAPMKTAALHHKTSPSLELIMSDEALKCDSQMDKHVQIRTDRHDS